MKTLIATLLLAASSAASAYESTYVLNAYAGMCQTPFEAQQFRDSAEMGNRVAVSDQVLSERCVPMPPGTSITVKGQQGAAYQVRAVSVTGMTGEGWMDKRDFMEAVR